MEATFNIATLFPNNERPWICHSKTQLVILAVNPRPHSCSQQAESLIRSHSCALAGSMSRIQGPHGLLEGYKDGAGFVSLQLSVFCTPALNSATSLGVTQLLQKMLFVPSSLRKESGPASQDK